MIKVAVIIPWFGKDLKGGAEQLAWQVSSRLNIQKDIDLTVLTTCSKSFLDDWYNDFYKEDEYIVDGLKVKRFSVDNITPLKFGDSNGKIISHKEKGNYFPVAKEDEDFFINENINSKNLENYIEKNKNEYDIFLFLPYLYGPIIKNINKVKNKAVLQPCLHDEGYAYLKAVRENFIDGKAILFNSTGELEIATKLYGPSMILKSYMVGSGIEVSSKLLQSEKGEPIVKGDYILFIGRRDATKNTTYLIEVFEEYVKKIKKDVKLVLAGVGTLPENIDKSCIIDLGLVSEDDKYNLIQHCKAMINPSENESFSRIIYEAWYGLKPVIVNKKCRATYISLLESSNAGWAFECTESLFNIFDELFSLNEDKLKTIAGSGFKYANEIANWDNIIQKYIEIFKSIISDNKKIDDINKAEKKVFQVGAGFDGGDAISEQMLYIDKMAKKQGFNSEIYCEFVSPESQKKYGIKSIDEFKDDENMVLIYHHSIGSKATDYTLDSKANKKCMIYHNITPSDFFINYDESFAQILKEGREKLPALKNKFDKVFGDSKFNCDELEYIGYKNTKVLPLVIEPNKWSMNIDNNFMKRFADGKKNILFVGRVSPNKCQHDLIELFDEYMELYGNARLIIAGRYLPNSLYTHKIQNKINESKYKDDIVLTGHISYQELFSCYMSADLFLSMSEHEGFGVPFVESMWFDLPILAYKSTAIPETLDSAAMMFDQKRNYNLLSRLIYIMLHDDDIREKIILEQKKIREKYEFFSLIKNYEEILKS
ncbi:glycosyltransferase [Halarcobacter sp.]|uniref:glycosyltransferase n=1 Tax=Halarcobacter sp. TaxID=2321133 RepID=UPI002AA8AE76|nr:glycosyltransferase [Halarcobacter sp.]